MPNAPRDARRLALHWQIVIGLVAGALFGCIVNAAVAVVVAASENELAAGTPAEVAAMERGGVNGCELLSSNGFGIPAAGRESRPAGAARPD